MGVTFVRKPPPGADEVAEIFATNSGAKRRDHRTLMPSGVGDTPSRQRIFVCRPASAADESVRETHSRNRCASSVPPAGERR